MLTPRPATRNQRALRRNLVREPVANVNAVAVARDLRSQRRAGRPILARRHIANIGLDLPPQDSRRRLIAVIARLGWDPLEELVAALVRSVAPDDKPLRIPDAPGVLDVPDDVRVVALGKGDADVVVRPPAVRRSRLLPTAAATATHAGTWTRQRLARNPVTVSIKTGWVAAWSAVVNEVALGRGLIGEVAAVDIAGGTRLLGPGRENDQHNKQGGEPCSKAHSALQPEPSVPRGAVSQWRR